MNYIVRSSMNPNLVLATNDEFMLEDCIGPGHKFGAKMFKRYANAIKVRNGVGIIVQGYRK